MRHHFLLSKWQILKRMIIPSVGEGVGWVKGILKHCWWECKLVQPFQKAIWQYVSKALKMSIPFDPAIPLPGIYPKEIIRDQAKMSAQGCYHSVFNNSEKLGTIQVSNNRQSWLHPFDVFGRDCQFLTQYPFSQSPIITEL